MISFKKSNKNDTKMGLNFENIVKYKETQCIKCNRSFIYCWLFICIIVRLTQINTYTV